MLTVPPQLVCITAKVKRDHKEEYAQGSGVVVAKGWVLTAWHVVSHDGTLSRSPQEDPKPATWIRVHREGARPVELNPPALGRDVFFATSEAMGGRPREDLALVRVDTGDVEPVVLVTDLENEEVIALGEADAVVFRLWGYPEGADASPDEFSRRGWDTNRHESPAAVVRHGRVLGGRSGGPLFALYDGKEHFVGVGVAGGRGSSLSQYVLGSRIRLLFEHVTAKLAREVVPFPKPRSIRTALLRRLLGRLVESCRSLPWTDLTIDELFVDRVVAELTAREGDGASSLRRGPLADHLADSDAGPARIVLRGSPGSGKSTLLRHHAYSVANQALSAPAGELPKERFPVFVRLPDLDERLKLGTDPWSVLLEEVGTLYGPYVRGLIEAKDPHSELTLLLDARRRGHRGLQGERAQ